MRVLILLVAWSTVLAWVGTAQASDQRKNIIFVLVDDLRFDALGFLRPELDTPFIDEIAENGVYFPNASVTSSLCSPSRATILTGQTMRNHRIVDNYSSSEEGLVFFPSYLQETGYETSFFGKWHMGQDDDDPRPGFDHWVSFRGQGTYQPVVNGRKQTLNVNGERVERETYITDELTDYAIEWLAAGRDPTKPFFLYLSHKAVHSELAPASRHVGQYEKVAIDLPQSASGTNGQDSNKPMWVQNQKNSWHGVDFPYHKAILIEDWVRLYYETLSSVDDSLGRIISYLRENDLEDDTFIVFFSDNGFLHGEHGLIDKRNAYEPSIRVPLIAYAPSMLPGGVTVDARVRNLDLAPTFLEVAGIAPPPQFEGKSFLSAAQSTRDSSEWLQDFVYEYYWEWNFPHTPTTFAIVRDNFKFIQYHGVWDIEELYDLERDPDEMVNLAYDERYADKKATLQDALWQSLANSEGQHTVDYKNRQGQTHVLRSAEGSRSASFPPRWIVTEGD